ncbi:4F2 cell-surface antigen heavy chain-like isoform X1 [Seriola lalandi dorsalis]|nr:4F2 cell-surface antigen heavy chain-like isoform X1 [Seriola lalandi dorsalis]XP_056230444.1 4F2 cell-surface antigen heavy chain isoform X1 [Seriola aureovittata]
MAQSVKEAAEETGSTTDRMPLDVGDTGYGSVPGPGLSGSVGGSETAPLLIPEPEPEPVQQWQPLTKEQLEVVAGGPGWRRVRCYMVLLFWLAWVGMLATSIAIIAISPRPVVTPLKWWQKSLFYQLQPDLFMEAEGSGGINVLCEQLPYLRSLGIGALILEGLFVKDVSPSNLTATGESLGTLPQIQHLLTESNKAGLKVVLDFCEVDLDVAGNEPSSAKLQHTLRFWLEQGVAGFAICDTDAAYSEKTLLEWRDVFREFSSQEEERIVVVKQTQEVPRPLNNSSQINKTLVDVVMRSILPSSHHLLSAQEVADAIETHLQTREDEIWPSWTVGGKASPDLKKLLLVLMMTLPGSPAVQYDEDFDQTQNVSLNVGSSHGEKNEPSDANTDKKVKRSTVALFTSLSHSRAREEALLYGSFTFLPFNTSANSSSSSNSTLASPAPLTILAFLRSWGCVHFLILLNVGPELHALDPAWAPSLPEAGVFVASTGMDRLGSTSLYTLELRPHEAIVIKLFEAGSYS